MNFMFFARTPKTPFPVEKNKLSPKDLFFFLRHLNFLKLFTKCPKFAKILENLNTHNMHNFG